MRCDSMNRATRRRVVSLQKPRGHLDPSRSPLNRSHLDAKFSAVTAIERIARLTEALLWPWRPWCEWGAEAEQRIHE